MKFKSYLLLLAILAAVIAGCSKKEPAPQPQPEPTVSDPAPVSEPAPAEPELVPTPEADTPPATETTSTLKPAAPLEGLSYVKGGPVTFEKGKFYVVEFWATWCPPCRASIPHLTEIQKQYKDKGVTVIGISTDTGDDRVRTDDDLDLVKAFVTEQGDKMNYTVAWDAKGKADAGYMNAYGQNGIPTAFIIDGNGNVAWFGHPMGGLDDVLPLVINGTFDPVAYAKAKAEREAAERRLYQLYQEYFSAVLKGSSIEQTRPVAEKFIELGHSDALNAMAWQILDAENKANRDVEIALKAAEKANTQTKGEDPMILDTYALALFENGKVAEAITAQEKAIALAGGNEEMIAAMKTRLDEFKNALTNATGVVATP